MGITTAVTVMLVLSSGWCVSALAIHSPYTTSIGSSKEGDPRSMHQSPRTISMRRRVPKVRAMYGELSLKPCLEATSSCFLDPCMLATCPNNQMASCRNYKCGTVCKPEFWYNGEEVTSKCETDPSKDILQIFQNGANGRNGQQAGTNTQPGADSPPPGTNAVSEGPVPVFGSSQGLSLPQQNTGSEGCPTGSPQQSCIPKPCDIHTCEALPAATCKNNFCGGCKAEFWMGQTEVTAYCKSKQATSSTTGPQINSGSLTNKITGAGSSQPDANTYLNPNPAMTSNTASNMNPVLTLNMNSMNPRPAMNDMNNMNPVPKTNDMNSMNPNPAMGNSNPTQTLSNRNPRPSLNTNNLNSGPTLHNINSMISNPSMNKMNSMNHRPGMNSMNGDSSGCPANQIRRCNFSPCRRSNCPRFPNAVCRSSNCGGCFAKYYHRGQEVTSLCRQQQGGLQRPGPSPTNNNRRRHRMLDPLYSMFMFDSFW